MPKMRDEEIKTIIARKLTSALSFHNSQLSDDRVKALKYYRGDKFGNEEEGHSQVVSRDVAEVIDTVLPGLMRVFTSGDRAVVFEPRGEEDTEAAEQATEYCGFIWNVDNPGFKIFHTWFKDALLQRNGFVKVWWEKIERSKVDRYQGLSEEQLATVTTPENPEDKVEVLDHVSRETDGQPGPDGMPTLMELHDITVRRTWKDGKVCVANVPPEEFVIDLDDAELDENTRFCAHRFRRTITDLIDQGYDKAKVKSIPKSEADDITTNEEAYERKRPEITDQTSGDNELDETMREVWVSECYIRIDADGDGKAELRKITVGGDEADVILDNEEVDDNCFASITPYPMPHKVYGESLADKTKDIQELKSAIWRQSMENLYLTNTPQKEVVDGQVNMEDLMTPRIGGYVRVKAIGQMREMPPQTVYQHGLKALEYVDTVREARTGITKYNQGLDANTLNKTATGINAIMGAAHMREELIARVFAETGVTRAFKLVLKNVIKYQDRKRVIRLRNKWVEIDPRYWNAEMDVAVSVGLGTGNKDQQLGHLNNLLMIQQKIVELQGGVNGPLVTAENLYNVLEKYIEAADLKSVERYFTDPAQAQPQDPKPDPAMMEAQGKMQMEQAKAQQDSKIKQQEAQQSFELAMAKAQADIQIAREKAMADIQLEREKAMAQIQLSRETAQVDMAMRQERHQFDLARTTGDREAPV